MKEQLEATYQRAAMLDSELREVSGEHEHTKAELQRVRQEAEIIRASLAQAQEECRTAQNQLYELRSQTLQKTVIGRIEKLFRKIHSYI